MQKFKGQENIADLLNIKNQKFKFKQKLKIQFHKHLFQKLNKK